MLDENIGTVGQVTSHDTPTNIQDRYIYSCTKGLLSFQNICGEFSNRVYTNYNRNTKVHLSE